MAKPRDEQILSAAAELFRKRGFAAVGVDEIGRQAGVSGPAIYRHFKSKDDILAALFDRGMDDLVDRTSGSFDDPEEELGYLIVQHAQAIISNPKLAAIWIHEGRSLSSTHRRRFQRRSDMYFSRWTDLLARCYPTADPGNIQVLARSAIGAINSIMDWPKELRTDSRVQLLSAGVLQGVEVLLSGDTGDSGDTAAPQAA